MNLKPGQTHVIIFTQGKLYLDGVQIAGVGVEPQKDVRFEFNVMPPQDPNHDNAGNRIIDVEPEPVEDNSVLKVNVSDNVAGKDIGPGQK